MATEIITKILSLVDQAPKGIPMGTLVQAVSQQGYGIEVVEQEIWSLLRQRKLTISGYVRRLLRRRESPGEYQVTPLYDFLLISWSPALDHQLDLDLEHKSP